MPKCKGPSLTWSRFYWKEYADDRNLKLCSLAAQGLWMRMLCEMYSASPHGHLTEAGLSTSAEDLASLVGKPLEEVCGLLDELERRKIFSRRGSLNDHEEFAAKFAELEVFGEPMRGPDDAIVSRRMVRDRWQLYADKKIGKGGGNPAMLGHTVQEDQTIRATGVIHPLKAGGNPRVNPRVNPTVNPEVNAIREEEKKEEEKEESKIPEASLQAAAAAHDKKQTGFFPDEPEPEPSATKLLFDQGIPILSALTGKTSRAVLATLLGKMRKEAQEDDKRLLEILLEAKTNPKADPIAWIRAAILARPRLVVSNDPGDDWGIQGWCKATGLEPTADPEDMKRGSWLAHGRVIDRVMASVAQAARLPRSWRGDWTPLIDWLAAGLHPTKDIVPAIEWFASLPDYRPGASLKIFNTTVEKRRAA